MPRRYDDEGDYSGEPQHEPPPSPPSLVGIVVAWLTGIKTWRRASIALVLGFSVLFGYLIYSNTQQVFELFSAAIRPAPPSELPYMTPMYTEVYRQVNKLKDALGPDLIAIGAFKVNILTNQQSLVSALGTGPYEDVIKGLIEDIWQYPQPAFRDDMLINHTLARLYLGRFVCLPPLDGWKSLRRLPVKELCFIGVPPDGIGLAGFIAGAWEEPLTVERRDQVESAFRNASETIVWRRKQLGGQ